jgi:NAD(P)-dependent dehydrogenase (short-subunit alcohol dehydrogenase family)
MERGLDSQIALVTGGTDGIGKAIARELAARGADVWIVGHDPEKGARAERELRASAGRHHVRFLQADLSLMRDTDRLAGEIIANVPKLLRLVLCAGVVRGRRLVTTEGVESNYAINYLSRFVLTGRLLPLLQAAGAPGAAARIARTTAAKCAAPPSARSSRSTEVITTCARPILATASPTRSGSVASSGSGLPVATLQKAQARVQTSPMIIMVAWLLSQHSPMFGQAASSQTVTRPCSRTTARVAA